MVQTTLKRSGMDHTAVYLQRTPCLPLPRKRSPDGASTESGGEHLIAAHYSFIDLERMKGLICTCHLVDVGGMLALFCLTLSGSKHRRTGWVPTQQSLDCAKSYSEWSLTAVHCGCDVLHAALRHSPSAKKTTQKDGDETTGELWLRSK